MKTVLGPLDYILFVGVIIVSAGVGFYFGLYKNKNKEGNVKDYLVGGRQMGILPVALSTLASFLSAITFLGNVAEVYMNGAIFAWSTVSQSISIGICIYALVPVLYPLHLTTSYQYLRRRFHMVLQIIGGSVFTIQMTLYLGIVLYAPALALEAVTGLNVWVSVIAVGVTCTIYTALGGIKAVMWTDVFQTIFMLSGLFLIVIYGSAEQGPGKIFGRAMTGGRLNFFNFDPNPTTRHTFWTLMLGPLLLWSGMYGTNQALVQRTVSSKSLRTAQIALLINLPCLFLVNLMVMFIGLVVYSSYYECDPIHEGVINSANQLFPLYVVEHINVPGFTGLFIASSFCGALSTISSAVNSLAAVVLKDIIEMKWDDIEKTKKVKLTKGLAFFFGALSLVMAWIASKSGKSLVVIVYGLFGMLNGPLMGVFFMGMLIPFANWKGALSGFIVSQSITLCMGFGSILSGYKSPSLPLKTDGCNTTQTFAAPPTKDEVSPFFRVSYMYYVLISVVIIFAVGLPVSYFTGKNTPKHCQKKFFSPIIVKYFGQYLHEDTTEEDEPHITDTTGTGNPESAVDRLENNDEEQVVIAKPDEPVDTKNPLS